jgi:hypothetical protein
VKFKAGRVCESIDQQLSAQDEEAAEWLWNKSVELVGL